MGKKIIRAATVGLSLRIFCKSLWGEFREQGYEAVALSSPDEDLATVAREGGVRTVGVPMERRFSPLRDLRSLFKLVYVFWREKPYMVHSMTPKAGLLCMVAAWMTHVPVRVHTFTGLVWPTSTGMTRRILMLTDKITCACATHVIPEGEGVKSDLINGGITTKPLQLLGYGNVMGVDMVKFSRRAEVMRGANEIRREDIFSFLFVGRIVRDKGINELVESFAQLLHRRPNEKLRLILVGPYEDALDSIEPETKRLIESMPEIEYVGPQFGEDLLPYYAAADCFVFPSYREGFPNTVMEAGAMGLPSIVTDINGSREIVVDYKQEPETATGLIIPSKDTEALLNAMVWMVTHAEERKLMAENARPRIEQRWEQGFVRSCLLDFYRRVLR